MTTQLTDKIWAYPIPDEVIEVSIFQFKHISRSIPYWHINWNYPKGHRYTSGGACFFYKMLGGKKQYPTNLKLLFTTAAATEEDARKVVEHDAFIDGYKDYDTDRFHHDTPFIKAIDSLISLLHSKGLNPDKNNIAIIEKLSSDE